MIKVTKMAKIFLICGKICSGKSTYAEQMRIQNHAVLLSVDEITLALFGQHCGDNHDDYVERTQNYLFDKSLELDKFKYMKLHLVCFRKQNIRKIVNILPVIFGC